MTVNVDNINATIARIRQNQNFKFNMRDWGAGGAINKDDEGHFCGTSACIAGFAALASGTIPTRRKKTYASWNDHEGFEIDVVDFASHSDYAKLGYSAGAIATRIGAEYLGITREQANLLFVPYQDMYAVDYMTDHCMWYHGPDYMEATEDEAIKVLENLRDTGVVDWRASGRAAETEGYFENIEKRDPSSSRVPVFSA